MELINRSIPNPKQTNFKQPDIYLIQVSGFLDKSWSDRLGGLEILCYEAEGSDDPPVTILMGELIDQAALFGVLNALYNNRYKLISVLFLGKGEHISKMVDR